MVRRHESLRTTFVETDGGAVQVVAPSEPRRRCRSLTSRGCRAASARRKSSGARSRRRAAPFDLSRGPLLRATLLRLGEEEHVLLATMHHIVSDGWSVGVLVRELSALYAAYTRGEESPLAELPIQYADYAVWQREHLVGRAARRAAHLLEGTAGGRAGAAGCADRPAAPRRAELPRGVAPLLALARTDRALARAESPAHALTLFMTLLAGWQALLSRYSGQEDIVRRHAHRGTDAARDGRPHRLLRQHAGAAH